MINASEQVDANTSDVRLTRGAEFFNLMTPRLNALVLLTTFVGFYLASEGAIDLLLLFQTLAATFLVAGGASTFNQVWERENDARMARTMNRPIAAGRIEPREALLFAAATSVTGCLWLFVVVNPLTSLLGFLSLVVYVLAYTPMKARSPLNTVVGAVSGALPPMMGWTAVRGTVSLEAWVLFGILFFWQHPHFFALSWKYREDYKRGGFRMLSSIDRDGRLSGWMMGGFSLLLVPVSVGLTLTGLTGWVYFIGSVLLGLAYFGSSVGFAVRRTDQAARTVFLTSLLYLPVLIVLMLADKIV